ncbi:hypothetical protein BJ322DRAFT_1068070 [Thelephora terrestris]|uniref:Secreted protein n=1 Tax=Thelephora terrestris TaxID=56493 RepID=A0A9P6HF82_9AGAM|nr:hypothetical protein BJ322DRAFT_1068070 [Thelephora terrestris]
MRFILAFPLFSFQLRWVLDLFQVSVPEARRQLALLLMLGRHMSHEPDVEINDSSTRVQRVDQPDDRIHDVDSMCQAQKIEA